MDKSIVKGNESYVNYEKEYKFKTPYGTRDIV